VALVVGAVVLGSAGVARAADSNPVFMGWPASGSSELQSAREGSVAASLGVPLFVSTMNTSSGGAVFANQLWGTTSGVLK